MLHYQEAEKIDEAWTSCYDEMYDGGDYDNDDDISEESKWWDSATPGTI